MIDLPVKPKPATNSTISMLVVFGFNKVGKTSNLLQLPNHFLLDLEESASYYGGNYLTLSEIMNTNKCGPVTAINMVSESISAKNKESGKKVYDYIIIDSLSILEDIANKYATYLYKKSVIGTDFKGEDVTAELPRGAGYFWLRKAFDLLLGPFLGLADTLILVGRVRDSAVTKDESEISAVDLDLTGKLKKIIGYNASAIGLMKKDGEDPNKTILSFINNSTDLATGTRVAHLRGKEFVISERNPETDEIVTHWDLVFPNLTTKA